ncbi:MAG: recombinase family protein, partial [Patescibacteria group bacterium]|nr:recombinase family protein [Patescibacteria group bacterium]
MNTVLFCRVSSKEQEETGYSLPSQEKLLKEYSTKKGFSVAKTFLISESASGTKQRKVFNEMLAFVKKEKIKIIVCEKTDRFTRNLKDAQLLYEWLDQDDERQIHLVKDSLVLHKNSRSQEKLNLDIRVVFAKNYIDNLSEEVKKGQKEKLAQGWLPMKPPLGYVTVGQQGHRIPAIEENTASLVRKMFGMCASGEFSLQRLTQRMFDLGLRYPNGGRVTKSRIHQLLHNPFYYGKIPWNGEIYNGKHEPIITKDLYDEVQKVLKRKDTPKYSKHFFVFRKLIACKGCGGVITWEAQKGHSYGHCNHFRNCSQKVWVKEPDIDRQLLHVFGKLVIKNPRINNWLTKVLEYERKDLAKTTLATLTLLQQQLDQIEKRIDKLFDEKMDEKITEEFYNKKNKQYLEEKEQVKQS